jgi:hypothetical protein
MGQKGSLRIIIKKSSLACTSTTRENCLGNVINPLEPDKNNGVPHQANMVSFKFGEA